MIAARMQLVAIAAVIAMLAPRPAYADESAPEAAARRVLIALRVLAYDRNLADRAPGAELSIIVVSGSSIEARRERARWLAGFALVPKVKVGGRVVKVHSIDFDSERAFDAAVAARRPAAVIAMSDLTTELAALQRVTRARKTLTFSDRETSVRGGLAVGLLPAGDDDDKDRIVINLAAARAEGVRFDAGLLQLARLVDETRR